MQAISPRQTRKGSIPLDSGDEEEACDEQNRRDAEDQVELSPPFLLAQYGGNGKGRGRRQAAEDDERANDVQEEGVVLIRDQTVGLQRKARVAKSRNRREDAPPDRLQRTVAFGKKQNHNSCLRTKRS